MTIYAENLYKSYGELKVLDDFSMKIEDGSLVAITGPSGIGKTTLLRILVGIEKPDKGKISLLGDYKYAYLQAGMVFQEDRLCEEFSAVENVSMVHPKVTNGLARRELEMLLPADCLDKPVSELSGGMKRRVSIVRAMCVPADFFVMDEPFTGLDNDCRMLAIEYILSHKGDNPLIITTHDMSGLDKFRHIEMK